LVKTKNSSRDGQATRVAFYTRISTDEDHQKYSLGAQSERLEAFCKAQYGDEWRLHKVYRDTESGTHMDRPGLEEMLFDAGAQAFDVLLVFRVDRLSRKVRELAQMVDELAKHGVILKSITEPFDTANAAGKMMLQMLGVFAEFEHATIVERTKVGMEKKAKGGQFVGGNVPYGFTLDPEKGLVINEDEAIVVRKIFQMYVFGREGAYTICHKLNEAGHRKRTGKKWDKRVVLHMLKNPGYVGKIRWRDAVYEGRHERIVSEVLFGKAKGILKERGESVSGRRFDNGDEHLLAGVIRCACCKSRLVGVSTRKKNRRFPYYLCSKRWNTHECDQDYVRADHLEAAIIQDIKTIFRDEAFVDRVWEEANRRLGAEKPALEKERTWIENQMVKTQAAVDRYFEAFETGALKAELCNEKVGDLNARLVELEAEKRDLETRRAWLQLASIDREMLTALIDNFDQVIAAGTNPQKKHLLRQVVKKVLVHDRNTIEVWYGLPNPASVHTRGCMATETAIQRHFVTLSPADTGELVEGVADLVVTSLQRKRNSAESAEDRLERACDLEEMAG
jgi:site-specific DNA recombinase